MVVCADMQIRGVIVDRKKHSLVRRASKSVCLASRLDVKVEKSRRTDHQGRAALVPFFRSSLAV